MSTYDKASLVLIPSGTKEGVIFSQKPTNGDGDFTFSRSTAATRVNSNGLIEKETQNLLLQSNNFDTTWVTTGTLTSGQSGYDGSNDAWLFDSGNIKQDITNTGVQTFSIYAKANTLDWIFMDFVGVPNEGAYFDVANGTIGTIDSVTIDAKIESVGSGWYRCSIVINTNAATGTRIYTAIANNNVSGSGSVYIQDAQLEEGLVARDYIETTTTAVYGGITDNVPRLDYTDSSCPSLLLEGQRSNLWKYSEYASGNSLVNSPTITQNYSKSPEGLDNSFRIQDTTGSTFKRIAESSGGFSVSVNSTYTQSLFVKKATSAVSSYGGIGFDYSGGTRQISYIIFDEYNGTMTALQSQSTLTLHDAEDYGDYWRFSISAKDTGSNTNLALNIYACLSTNGTSPTTGTKDWTGYGFQLEQGAYATSYIPTYGTSVTRNADAASKTGVSDLIGQTEGTIFIEFDAEEDAPQNMNLINFNNSTQASVLIAKRTSGALRAQVFAGGSAPVDIDSAIVSGKTKAAIAYKSGDSVLYVNGVGVSDSSTFTFNGTLSDVIFPSHQAYFNYGHKYSVNQALLFKTRLTNEELATLTTL